MAGLDERLNQLFSNQDSAKSAFDMMQALLSTQEGTAVSGETGPDANGAEHSAPHNQTLSTLALLLPQFLQAMSGEADLVKQERVALLKAMRPYLKESRLPSIERALRLANLTKAASSAMKHFGR